MNIKKTLLFIALGLFLISACQAQKKQSQHIHRQWMLIAFQDYEKEFLIKNRAELNLTKLNENPSQYSAFMGCNQLMISKEIQKKSKIKLEVIGSTSRYCDGNMDLEKKFRVALSKIKNYTIEGHFLTLDDEKGNKMKFVAADWD